MKPARQSKMLKLKRSLTPLSEEALENQAGGVNIWGCCFKGAFADSDTGQPIPLFADGGVCYNSYC